MNKQHRVNVSFIQAKKWWQLSRWELIKPLTSLNKEVTVPTGYVTDGASIPFIARAIFSPTGKYFPAAIIHDYLITEEKNWEKANYQFGIELEKLHITKWRKALILAAVKMWSKINKK